MNFVGVDFRGKDFKNITPLRNKEVLNMIVPPLLAKTPAEVDAEAGVKQPAGVVRQPGEPAVTHRHVHVDIKFGVGDIVKIIEGPFETQEVKVEQIDMDSQQLRATVTMFGRETPLLLSFDQVATVDTPLSYREDLS
jgi:transcriptional antiterminator NusG